MYNWIKKMTGQKDAGLKAHIVPTWERLWNTPEWALRARREFPWRNKKEMKNDLQEWLGSGWLCQNIMENSLPGAPTGAYDYRTQIISLNSLAWAELQRGFRGELTEERIWQLLHLIIHEAMHGYSPSASELQQKGLGLSNDEYIALKVFEEGFTECIVKGILSQWSILTYLEDKRIRSGPPLDLYPVEVGMIEDLAGEARKDNIKLKEWWNLPNAKLRIERGDKLTLDKIEEVLSYAGIRPEELKIFITLEDSNWLFFYPYQENGKERPPASLRKEGRILPIMLKQAEVLRNEPRERALEWARNAPWGYGDHFPPSAPPGEVIFPEPGSTRAL